MNKVLSFAGFCRALIAAAMLCAGSAYAAPILMDATGDGMASNMRLTQHVVTFRGEDGMVMTGRYSTGPWKKSLFGLINQNTGGGETLPVVQQVGQLPEPSTLALLGLGLLAAGILSRRRVVR